MDAQTGTFPYGQVFSLTISDSAQNTIPFMIVCGGIAIRIGERLSKGEAKKIRFSGGVAAGHIIKGENLRSERGSYLRGRFCI